MHRLWQSTIAPVFDVLQPRTIVEIGVENGKNTRNLLEFLRTRGGILHAIDPSPQFDAPAWQREYGGVLCLHRARSLEVLRNLEGYDAVLIDGDHNWHTVYHELRQIEDSILRSGVPALVLLHDVSWPYDRRDLYYDPAAIPGESRQPHVRGGLVPGVSAPVPNAGLNAHAWHAEHAGGQRNGVLTAVEDFLAESKTAWVFLKLPEHFGLGILAPETLLVRVPALRDLLRTLGDAASLLRRREEHAAWLARLRELYASTESIAADARKVRPSARWMLALFQNSETADHVIPCFERQHLLVHTPKPGLCGESPSNTYDLVLTDAAYLARTDLENFAASLHRGMAIGAPVYILQEVEIPGRRDADAGNRTIAEAFVRAGFLNSGSICAGQVLVFRKMRTVDIVIPIFNAYPETVRCIESVLRCTNGTPHRIVLIDDRSSDARMVPHLQWVAERSARVQLIAHGENRGFVKTANEGMTLSKDHDVVLLNSDTEVTEGWLERLMQTAYDRPACASVMPLSNEASIYSLFPDQFAGILKRKSLTEISALVAEESLSRRPEIPTSVGFCMLLKRDAIDTVGIFDEAFGMGYGEENDWCMRARTAGYRHYLDDRCFVYHKGHVSMRAAGHIGSDATTNPENERLLRAKHPYFEETIRSYRERNTDMPEIRRHFTQVFIAHLTKGTPCIAHLLHKNPAEHTGGTEYHVLDLAEESRETHRTLIVFPQPAQHRLVVSQCAYGLQHDSHFDLPQDMETEDGFEGVFQTILQQFGVDLLHVHHCMHTSFRLIGTAKSLGIPVVYTVHDYYALSPQFNLLGKENAYAGIPAPEEYYDEHLSLTYGEWRRHIRPFLAQADRIIAPSRSALSIFDQVYGDVGGPRSFIEHGTDAPLHAYAEAPHKNRICFLGSSHRHAKGRLLVAAIAPLLGAKGKEIVLLGSDPRHWPELAGTPGISFFGTYERNALPKLLAEIKPALVCLLSAWPETFCYALSECWMADVPAYVADAGALAERMGRWQGGRVAPTGDPAALVEDICTFMDSGKYADAQRKTAEIRLPSRRDMWEATNALYAELLQKART